MSIRIIFVGAGRMASAIVKGLLEQQHYVPEEIACTCGEDPTGRVLAEQTGIHYCPDITHAVATADVLILACKPNQLFAINAEWVRVAENRLILSILAGTSLTRLSQKFSTARNIVRTMPNTPGQIGYGVTAYAPLKELSDNDQTIVIRILSSLGHYHRVNESDLDAVTALSGSGPAYIFEFTSALLEAGIRLGLEPELARALVYDTLLGSSKLLLRSEASPEDLRQAVTSPGGTTAAALKVLEAGNFRALMAEAVAQAEQRSRELG